MKLERTQLELGYNSLLKRSICSRYGKLITVILFFKYKLYADMLFGVETLELI